MLGYVLVPYELVTKIMGEGGGRVVDLADSQLDYIHPLEISSQAFLEGKRTLHIALILFLLIRQLIFPRYRCVVLWFQFLSCMASLFPLAPGCWVPWRNVLRHKMSYLQSEVKMGRVAGPFLPTSSPKSPCDAS